MIYEITTSYTTVDNNGNDKVVKEKYLVENVNTFSEAEYLGLEEVGDLENGDVIAIKRSKLREIINKRSNEEEDIYFAEVADIRINDDGEQVEFTYKVACFAINFDDAHSKINLYIKQGLDDMVARGIKHTKFLGVI